MHRQPVTSSNLVSVGYDPALQVLEVEFHDHSVFQYYRVLPPVYHELMAAESHGKYFAAHVRGVYEYHRQGEPL